MPSSPGRDALLTFLLLLSTVHASIDRSCELEWDGEAVSCREGTSDGAATAAAPAIATAMRREADGDEDGGDLPFACRRHLTTLDMECRNHTSSDSANGWKVVPWHGSWAYDDGRRQAIGKAFRRGQIVRIRNALTVEAAETIYAELLRHKSWTRELQNTEDTDIQFQRSLLACGGNGHDKTSSCPPIVPPTAVGGRDWLVSSMRLRAQKA